MASYGPGTNTGHGHVWKRPDGVKMRCGGQRWCNDCAADFATFGEPRNDIEINILHAKVAAMELWSSQLEEAGGTGTFFAAEIRRRLAEAEYLVRHRDNK
jgi:hypothetical protein